MALWLIGGGIFAGAWAMLSVVGSELTRRTNELKSRQARPRPAEPK